MTDRETVVAGQLASRSVAIAALSALHSLGDAAMIRLVEQRAYEILGELVQNDPDFDTVAIIERGQQVIKAQIDIAAKLFKASRQ
jgi:hypothetical protein